MTLQTGSASSEREVSVPAGRHHLEAILVVPPETPGIVVFAHGSGSGRFSPRNQQVARTLQQGGTATLLIDLLEGNEAEDREKVFDVELLAERLQFTADWLAHEPATAALRLGYFGASTGGGAALVAAARQPGLVHAIVSRGGRPDLAWDDLPQVQAPTLLLVGGEDRTVLALNEEALACLNCPCELKVIPGATHLFPEPGALEEVARLAEQWFRRHLAPENVSPPRKG